MSQHAAKARPAPRAGPLIAPMTGTAQSVIAHIASRAMRPGSVTSEAGCRPADVPRTDRLQIDAGHEGPVAGGREDRDPDITVVGEPGEHVDDLGKRAGVDRVDRRPVKRDGGDVVNDVDAQVTHEVGSYGLWQYLRSSIRGA